MPQPGNRVLVKTKKGTEEGVLMPSPDEKAVIIKLDTGYNLGFLRKEVKSLQVVSRATKAKTPQTKKQKDKIQKDKKQVGVGKKLSTIAILHTGGTIASKVDYRTGGVTTDFSPEELISLFPELRSIANVKSELISQMWSDDLRFKHFSVIAEKIKEYVKKRVDGIIIGMGTDNLAVAAAALAFIVEQSPIPILLVGAQRSSDRGSSDAGMNLICAAEFIAQTDFAGVAICMHASSHDRVCAILPATKTYKLHSSRRDAFKAINSTPIAHVGYNDRKVVFVTKDYDRPAKELIIKPKMEEKVGLLRIHINMFPEQFLAYKGFKGLILEGTGLGHTPGQAPNKEALPNKKIYAAIKELVAAGCVIVMTTQCIFGGVSMNVYDKGRDLLGMGVIAGRDMLANTALVKLSWLLANYSTKDVQHLIAENLRGEINEQLVYEEEFI